MLGVDRDLSRVFDIDDATKVKLAGDRVTEIGKQLTSYDAVSAGLFVISPSLVDVLADMDGRSERPSLTEGVAVAATRGLVVAHDVGTKLWQDLDSAEMKLHAEWLLRVYGDELARPAMQAAPPSSAAGTLELIERLLAEKDQPGLRAVQPGAGDDVGAREGVAGSLRRLSPRRRLRRRRRAPAGEAAARVRRVAGPRDAAADRLGHRGDGDVDRVGGARRARSCS